MNGEPPRLIKPPPRRGLIARLRTYFFTGVVVTAPIGITVWLLWLVVDLFDRAVFHSSPTPTTRPTSWGPTCRVSAS